MGEKRKITIHFLGAAETVTGSKYLVDTGEQKILVDCGMFQGIKKLRMLNWEGLQVDVKEIDAVLLTHGHLDHTGYLPRLVKSGYRGPIYGTNPTLGIANIILLDSAKIQEEEADRANDEGYSRHNRAKPLYDLRDAQWAIDYFTSVPVSEWLDLFPGIRARFQCNGHILGSTFIELEIHGKRLLFSGDIGRIEDPLLRAPAKPKRADILFMESTYGDRLHLREDLGKVLQEIILHTISKGGTLIIPSFAVERAQTLMYLIWKLKEEGSIPGIPLILDSPMGANVLQLFSTHEMWHKLPMDECKKMCEAFRIVEEFKETWEVIDLKKPKIVIAGSGMITGGRVLTYLQQFVEKPETSVLLVGYQAEGTRGRKLLEGAAELKIYGGYYPVKAEVFNIQSLSAHADQFELLDWLSEIKNPPERTFIVHGERQASDTFRVKIRDVYGWKAVIPELYSIEDIEWEED